MIYDLISLAVTLSFGYWLFRKFDKIERRLGTVERNEATKPSPQLAAMDSVENVTAMFAGLRRRLIDEGFTPQAAEQLVQYTALGATTQRKP